MILFENFAKIAILFESKGHSRRMGDNSHMKNKMGQIFFMENQHMKFQDPSIQSFGV